MNETKAKSRFFKNAAPLPLGFCLLCWLGGAVDYAQAADALENYVAKPDPTYSWTKLEQRQAAGFTITHLQLVSQNWRDITWTHDIQVVRPEKVRNPGIAFLLITGDGPGERQLGLVRTLAQRAGAIAAVVTRVPNQPLFDGRKEDALIAFTFQKYLETGDETWPLLFPMVKTAVRAMDAVQAFAAQEYQQKIQTFVVSGASKRGWTTWLTAAVDPRVKAIAPMVIDMLNMKTQLNWMEKVYGHQSEKIHDYTELKLHERQDEPAMVKLRSWIDPYSYRERYTLPKLLLLGSNDPYWTVDSLRHYWNDLPAPKLLFITPNAGHDLAGGRESLPTLAAFFEMLADGKPLPKIEWQIGDTPSVGRAVPSTPYLAGHAVPLPQAEIRVKVNQPARRIRLWTSSSPDRDFRDDQWTATDLPIIKGSSQASAVVPSPTNGYSAYLAEVVLTSPTGKEYKLSTEARVTPDSIK